MPPVLILAENCIYRYVWRRSLLNLHNMLQRTVEEPTFLCVYISLLMYYFTIKLPFGNWSYLVFTHWCYSCVTNLLAIMPMTNSIAPIRRPRKANASMPNFHDVSIKQKHDIISVMQVHTFSHSNIQVIQAILFIMILNYVFITVNTSLPHSRSSVR